MKIEIGIIEIIFIKSVGLYSPLRELNLNAKNGISVTNKIISLLKTKDLSLFFLKIDGMFFKKSARVSINQCILNSLSFNISLLFHYREFSQIESFKIISLIKIYGKKLGEFL